ncbi:hypothetical protein PRIPAC_93090, partial [Pristionchus pacificus]|uniref:Uncharacterized protein n=1 Tax=Pristionchus pacificus TaxID=54126 RepID=A0A2A6CDF6_PRIPA
MRNLFRCAGSSTSFSEPLVIVGPDQASTVINENLKSFILQDLLISAESQASEADNRPSGSHVQSAVQADAASTPSYRPSHAFVHHPYARPVYRTRATVYSVRTEQECAGSSRSLSEQREVDESTIADADLDLVMTAEANAIEADDRPSTSQVDAPCRRSHSFVVNHPYAWPGH